MNFENLVNDLARNPEVMSKIEAEIQRLVEAPDTSELYAAMGAKNPAVPIFLCKILEMRVKRKIGKMPIDEEIKVALDLLSKRPSEKICDVVALMGLYCWPLSMPDFLSIIGSLLGTTYGYSILFEFLSKVNTNCDIDEKRRSELKKAINMVIAELIKQFDERFAAYIIKIYTELLRIVPKTFDYAFVFAKAPECQNEALDFFSEALPLLDQNRLVKLLDDMDADIRMVHIINSFKMSKVQDLDKIYRYMFSAIGKDECFPAVVDFWIKIFSSPANENLLKPVLNEITKSFLEAESSDEQQTPQIHGFYNVVAKNFPEQTAEFIQVNESIIPTRIISNILQKMQRVPPSLSFQSTYLHCQACFLRRDPGSRFLLPTLDFNDKDAVKLGIQLVNSFEYTPQELETTMRMCEGKCLNANELRVECMERLGIEETFDTWDMNKVIMFYHLLKKKNQKYLKYREQYYALFLQSAPFDRCFAILRSLSDVPNQILANIYENIDKYPYGDLACFNNDLLPWLGISKPFLEKEVARFNAEWSKVSDHNEYNQAIKSLITVLEMKVGEEGAVDLLVGLLPIDNPVIVNRILGIFMLFRGEYNVRKAVYYLLHAYNAPSLSSSQTQISGGLTNCLMHPEGAEAYHEIVGIDAGKCGELRQQMAKVNRKTAQNMIRELLKDYRGKTYAKMFESTPCVTEQCFIPKGKKKDDDSDQVVKF